jgi:hypothetical protein
VLYIYIFLTLLLISDNQIPVITLFNTGFVKQRFLVDLRAFYYDYYENMLRNFSGPRNSWDVK